MAMVEIAQPCREIFGYTVALGRQEFANVDQSRHRNAPADSFRRLLQPFQNTGGL
jgi:hypothetical protein